MASTRHEIIRNQAGYEVHVLGAPSPGLRDLYHAFLRVPWWGAFLVIVGGYLGLNALFAVGYLLTGGVANARPGAFSDAFYFSVQTMGTIGYGAMYPVTPVANALVVAESVVGLVVTALATGLVFVRFSQSRARVVFSARVSIALMDGEPTLMVRVGNERRGSIVDATFRLTLTRTTRTAEGMVFYRSEALPLVRDRATALARSWSVRHRITPGSPLFAETPESLAACDAEITLQIAGTDETSLQPVHARHNWPAGAIAWGARLADVLSETPEGHVILDLRRFHDVEPMAPTAAFPYPRA